MQFKVIKSEGWYLVVDASMKALSAALVPSAYRFAYSQKADAMLQASKLSGQIIETRMIETPDRFEEMADIMYGPAWQ